MSKTSNIFISYSHETKEHQDKVLNFCTQLRNDGIDAQLDRYVEIPAEGWPRWMIKQLESADFVLCICSSAYRVSFEGKNTKEKGLGVNAEGFFILQDIYDNNNVSNKYIPIIFEPYNQQIIPVALRPFGNYRIPYEYEKLYSFLTHQSLVKPPLGKVKKVKATTNSNHNPVLKSQGFEKQQEIVSYIRPEIYPADKLAPEEGIFLSRIINPGIGSSDITSTIWISCRGNFQYFLNSMHVKFMVHGIAGPAGDVAVTPDADYQFTYNSESDYEKALVPALSIGPDTRNYTSFTVSATLDKPLYYIGNLCMWINYHRSDGRVGALELREPSKGGKELAKLIGKPILFTYMEGSNRKREQVIAREGIQCGLEAENLPVYHYIPYIYLYSFEFGNRSEILLAREKAQGVIQSRAELHKELKNRGCLPTLKKWLSDNNFELYYLAADLLGGLADEESTNILLDALRIDSRREAVLDGLCLRHLIKGDNLLASVALKNHQQSEFRLDRIKNILAVKPSGEWVKVMYLDESIFDPPILFLISDQLSLHDLDLILDSEEGPMQAPIYVRGIMNSWQCRESERLRYLKHGIYHATLSLDTMLYEFKISDDYWSQPRNCGGSWDHAKLELNKEFIVTIGESSTNMVLDLSDQTPGEFLFEFNIHRDGTVTLLISRR